MKFFLFFCTMLQNVSKKRKKTIINRLAIEVSLLASPITNNICKRRITQKTFTQFTFKTPCSLFNLERNVNKSKTYCIHNWDDFLLFVCCLSSVIWILGRPGQRYVINSAYLFIQLIIILFILLIIESTKIVNQHSNVKNWFQQFDLTKKLNSNATTHSVLVRVLFFLFLLFHIEP